MAKKHSDEINVKHLLKSKTFWLNALVVLGGVVEWAQGQTAIGATVTLLGALNIALRLTTKTAVKV